MKSAGRLSGARILVVEDEVVIAMDIASTMEENGATVLGPAHTLTYAKEYAAREDISAAILDLRLGRDSVSDVACILDARGIPFIFYSGQPPGDPIRDEWPDVPLVTKPSAPMRLVDAVARLVEFNS